MKNRGDKIGFSPLFKGGNVMKSDQQKKSRAGIYVALAFLALLVIIFIPTPASLPVAGKYSLAVLVFAVILWMTEAVSYPVSAVMIGGLISLLMGISPTIEDPPVTYGTTEALKLALSGFSTSAVALVAAALFFAAAMEVTGLHNGLPCLFYRRSVPKQPV